MLSYLKRAREIAGLQVAQKFFFIYDVFRGQTTQSFLHL